MLCSMGGINHSDFFFHVIHAGSPRLKSVEVCFLLSSASLRLLPRGVPSVEQIELEPLLNNLILI